MPLEDSKLSRLDCLGLFLRNQFFRILGIVSLAFLINLVTSSIALAAPTTVTGIISNIPVNSYTYVSGEKKIGDNWINIPGAYYEDVPATGSYTLNLGEVTGSQIRIWVRISSSNTLYLMGGDSITPTSNSITKNFSLGTINFKLKASTASHCILGGVSTTFVTQNLGPTENYLETQLDSSGFAYFALPIGNSYSFTVNCGGSESSGASVENLTSTSSLQTVVLNIPEPNLVGTISGLPSAADISFCVEKQSLVNSSSYQCQYSLQVNSSGQYAIKIPQGNYRISVNPNYTSSGNELINTFSQVFSIGSSQSTVNFAMSTTANVIIAITPASAAKDGWVSVTSSCAYNKKIDNCALTKLGRQVPTSGVVKFNLDPGSYHVSVNPGENTQGYTRTEIPDITVLNDGSIVNQSIALNLANLKFVVSPIENAKYGSLAILNNSTQVYYECELYESGECSIYAPSGTYSARIQPGIPSVAASFTEITELVVTGSFQIVNVTLRSSNVTGTVLDAAISAGKGFVRAEQKKSINGKEFWQSVGVHAQIDATGKFAFAISAGSYRLIAQCSSENCKDFLSSPSEIFTVSSENIIVNITLRTPNLTGSVNELAFASGGHVGIAMFDKYFSWEGDNFNQFGSQIFADGSYQLFLPDGKYKLKAQSNNDDYSGITSDWITISTTPQTLDLLLAQKNITGTVLPIAKSKGGWGYIEKLVSNNWEHINENFSINDSGTYKLYLPIGTYRASVNPNPSSTGVFNLISEPFTIIAGANIVNFTLPSTNFSLPVTPAVDAKDAGVQIYKIGGEKHLQWYRSTNVNSSGNIEAYLPNGRYQLEISPNSLTYVNTKSVVFDIPSSGEFPIPTTLPLAAANISGAVTPVDFARWAQVCLELKTNDAFVGRTVSCTNTDNLGKYRFKAENGTYRIIVYPQRSFDDRGVAINSPYVITTGTEFTINNDSKVVNLVLSTGNLSGTISDTTKSPGGWIYVLEVSGSYPVWTPYSAQISTDGKYAFQLPNGKYRLQIRPAENMAGVVSTESSDVTISGSSVVFNVALNTPNITGVITPIDKSSGGWIYAEQVSCNCGWNGWSGAPGISAYDSVNSDGSYGIKVENGLTRLVVNPRWDAVGVTKTVSESFTMSAGAVVSKSLELSTGNLTGTISSIENARGGWIRVERKDGNFWNYTNYGTHILNDGTFRTQVENGTYRIVASPGWNASAVVETPSAEFSINNDSININLTLSAPNLNGTISNLAAAVDLTKLQGQDPKFTTVAYGSLTQKVSGNFYRINKYISVTADGKFSAYLPDGTYSLDIYHLNDAIQGLSRANSGEFTISGATNTHSFNLGVANLRGTISPLTDSAWGWVCAELQVESNWSARYCDQIKGDGSYAMTVDPGTYRIVANPNWNSIGYSSSISDTAVVGSSGVTTISSTLASNNVILTINDLSGRANYQGWVSIKSGDTYLSKYGKGGWISQLGKVGFKLDPGVYTLEIQPAADRTGVRTTTSITVPDSGILESVISLAAGNIQGEAKNSSNGFIACAFITATAAGQTTVKAISKSDGTFTLNLTSGLAWSISAIDPATGQTGTVTLTPNGTSSNALTITTS